VILSEGPLGSSGRTRHWIDSIIRVGLTTPDVILLPAKKRRLTESEAHIQEVIYEAGLVVGAQA
jgi:hypothetical protein